MEEKNTGALEHSCKIRCTLPHHNTSVYDTLNIIKKLQNLRLINFTVNHLLSPLVGWGRLIYFKVRLKVALNRDGVGP